MFDYTAPDQLLKNRVILITGAGDGIGRAAAIDSARLGATVILLGRTIEKLEVVYDEIENAGYPQAAIYPLDLRSATDEDYISLAQVVEDEFGGLDGLVHNASILGQRTPLSNYESRTWNLVMQVNATAPFMMTQALLPLLEVSKDASIIFTSSSVGAQGKAYWGAYSVSKFATEGMAQILADETGNTSKIRVNIIDPGATRTSMRAQAYPGENPAQNPLPKDIMPVYQYLLGPDSLGITGQRFKAQ
ncbi:YciK family oxidoreductase [Oceanospirillaceae bacterium]|jgi:NAD(P)-dependent dehydrogenase (short-subunit alcohol dehydrogenase family)|uniref:YciK family oxidoreductase n=1 Tax=Candidatus Njordibacter sp. Uisw_002 TaxID=3230971 RepID=UPI00236BE05C|nr:YciK family oxidoreductase [Oceanospirillaceae bacterium]|tara:strand:+ start:15399 stop:16139 length:741 start_codon:yes stop_codon:yes gene_type:complete